METEQVITTRVLPEPPETPAVVVGMNPPASGLPAWVPTAGSTAQLARFVGCAPEHLGRHFGLANLCNVWTRTDQPTREALKVAAARAVGDGPVHEHEFRFVRGFRYVLAGNEVTRALGPWARPVDAGRRMIGYGLPICSWYVCRGGHEVAVIPHPSRRNRVYNDESVRGLVAMFLRSCAWRGETGADELWRGRPLA